MPFVALHLYNDGDEDNIKKEFLMIFLSCSLTVWLILNIAFFCTIDLSFANTFIGIKTGPQLACERFKETEIDESKFRVAFKIRSSYTESIHDKVRTWVGENIAGWREEKPDWFNIDLIPNDMLPEEVLLSEGGAARKRRSSSTIFLPSSTNLRELVS